jgi:uncharacterized protein HemX
MLKRLGAVAWWLGALVIALATGLWAWGQVQHRGCAAALRLNAEIQASRDAAIARYAKEHATGDSVLNTINALDNVPRDPRDTESFQQTVIECRSTSDSYIELIVAVFITLVLWSVAFVFGGSFWRPPRSGPKQP